MHWRSGSGLGFFVACLTCLLIACWSLLRKKKKKRILLVDVARRAARLRGGSNEQCRWWCGLGTTTPGRSRAGCCVVFLCCGQFGSFRLPIANDWGLRLNLLSNFQESSVSLSKKVYETKSSCSVDHDSQKFVWVYPN